jgi:hypothetical protein
MSALLTLTRREILDRRPLLWGTFGAALIPILARFQWWLPAAVRRDYHETLAAVFGITFPIALAIGLGASVVGEDLAGRRLGFYFSRPVSGLAIWASKTLAAVLLTLIGWSFFVLPALVLTGASPSPATTDFIRKAPEFLPAWWGLLFGLVLVAQAVAGAYRARDGLFALDIALFAVVTTALYLIGSRLSSAAGWRFTEPANLPSISALIQPAIAAAALAAGLAAAAQVVVGRSDARRGHVALSACLWGTLGVGVAVAAVFSHWMLSVTPRDTGAAEWSVRTTASASHLSFAAGRPRFGYWPAFLVDTRTGDFEAFPPARVSWGPVFSQDGRRAVRLEIEDGMPTLVLSRLDGSGPRNIRSSLSSYADSPPFLAGLSPDGKLAVVGTPDRLSFVDTDSGREAVAFSHAGLGLDRRGSPWHSQPSFAGDSVWLFFQAPPPAGLPVAIVRANLRTGQATPGPHVQGSWMGAIRDGRALIRGADGMLELVKDGEVIRLLAPEAGATVDETGLLEDGRAVAVVLRSGKGRLAILDHNERREIDLPAGKWRIGGEPRPGWLALSDFMFVKTLLIDLRSGAVVRSESGFIPAAGFPGHHENLPAGSPGSRLFVGARGEVVLLDPGTWRPETVLVPPRSGEE